MAINHWEKPRRRPASPPPRTPSCTRHPRLPRRFPVAPSAASPTPPCTGRRRPHPSPHSPPPPTAPGTSVPGRRRPYPPLHRPAPDPLLLVLAVVRVHYVAPPGLFAADRAIDVLVVSVHGSRRTHLYLHWSAPPLILLALDSSVVDPCLVCSLYLGLRRRLQLAPTRPCPVRRARLQGNLVSPVTCCSAGLRRWQRARSRSIRSICSPLAPRGSTA